MTSQMADQCSVRRNSGSDGRQCNAELQSSLGVTVLSVHNKQSVTLLQLRAHEHGAHNSRIFLYKAVPIIIAVRHAELRDFKTTYVNNAFFLQ